MVYKHKESSWRAVHITTAVQLERPFSSNEKHRSMASVAVVVQEVCFISRNKF